MSALAQCGQRMALLAPRQRLTRIIVVQHGPCWHSAWQLWLQMIYTQPRAQPAPPPLPPAVTCPANRRRTCHLSISACICMQIQSMRMHTACVLVVRHGPPRARWCGAAGAVCPHGLADVRSLNHACMHMYAMLLPYGAGVLCGGLAVSEGLGAQSYVCGLMYHHVEGLHAHASHARCNPPLVRRASCCSQASNREACCAIRCAVAVVSKPPCCTAAAACNGVQQICCHDTAQASGFTKRVRRVMHRCMHRRCASTLLDDDDAPGGGRPLDVCAACASCMQEAEGSKLTLNQAERLILRQV